MVPQQFSQLHNSCTTVARTPQILIKDLLYKSDSCTVAQLHNVLLKRIYYILFNKKSCNCATVQLSDLYSKSLIKIWGVRATVVQLLCNCENCCGTIANHFETFQNASTLRNVVHFGGFESDLQWSRINFHRCTTVALSLVWGLLRVGVCCVFSSDPIFTKKSRHFF